jgi:hypothetical protein
MSKRSNLCREEVCRYLDAGQTKETRLLVLEVLVHLVGVVAIHLTLLHERERDT